MQTTLNIYTLLRRVIMLIIHRMRNTEVGRLLGCCRHGVEMVQGDTQGRIDDIVCVFVGYNERPPVKANTQMSCCYKINVFILSSEYVNFITKLYLVYK